MSRVRMLKVCLAPLAVLLIVLLLPPVTAAKTQKVLLDWEPSKYDLAPGYLYNINLHAEYDVYVLGTTMAGVKAGAEVFRIELEAGCLGDPLFAGIKSELRVFINGEKVYSKVIDGAVVDRVVQVEIDASGYGKIIDGGQIVATFTISGPVDLYVHEESKSFLWCHIESRVEITRSNLVVPTGTPIVNLPPVIAPSDVENITLLLIGAGALMIGIGVVVAALRRR